MKNAYPVFIQKHNSDYLIYIPDIDHYTEGSSLRDAIHMARDLLGTVSLERNLPNPSSVEDARRIAEEKADEPDFKFSIGSLMAVDINTDDYKGRMTQELK